MMWPIRRDAARRSNLCALAVHFLALGLPPLAGAQGGQGGPPPTPVKVDAVRVQRLAHHRLVTGDLRAEKRSLVSAREAGIVIDFPIDEGQVVRQGETLARLDSARLELELTGLAADRAVSLAQRDEQSAAVQKLEQEERRIRASLEQGAGSPKELDDIEADLAVARARQAGMERAVEVVDARIRLLERQVADMTIVAPFSGHIVAKRTEVGQWLGAGDHVVEMIAVDRVEAWINVPQEHFALLASGPRSIEYAIDATGASRSVAEYRLLPQVDPRARSFVLIALLENDGISMTPGMSVQAWIPTTQEADRITVPKAAVNRGDGGFFVFAVESNGGDGPPQAVRMRVDIEFPLADRYAVRAPGLREGDLVIIEGNERLFPMAPLQILNEPAATASDDAPEAGGAS